MLILVSHLHMSSDTSSTAASQPWASAVLFVGTVLASQALQYALVGSRRDKQKSRSSAEEDRWRTDDFPRTKRIERSNGRQSGPSQRMMTRERIPSDASPYDFLPKNRNWAHFDLSKWNTADSFKPKRKTSLDESRLGEPPDENDETSNSNSDNAESSDQEESFLWTSASSTKLHHCDDENSKSQLSRGVSPPEAAVAPVDTHGNRSAFEQPSRLPSWLAAMRRSEGEARSPCEVRQTSFDGDYESNAVLASERSLKEHAQDILDRPPTDPPRRTWLLRRYTSNLERYPHSRSMISTEDGDEEMEIQWHNRNARAQYNAQIMPNKVVMVRHGESMGNIDEELYSTTPDNAMPLTKLGWEEARKAGSVLKRKVLTSGETVHFIVSPYVRTVETFHGLVSAWCDPSEFSHISDREERLKAWYGRLLELGLTWHEDPRIREQDFGNYQDPKSMKAHKRERSRFGTFFYRFPHGESASDVFDRVSTFLDSLWRSFDLNRSRNYVLVTHGISIRVLLARYFRYSIDQFNVLSNPKNCEMIILGHDGEGRLQLNGRCEVIHKETASGEVIAGHAFHKRLRVQPQQSVKKAKIRISYDDSD